MIECTRCISLSAMKMKFAWKWFLPLLVCMLMPARDAVASDKRSPSPATASSSRKLSSATGIDRRINELLKKMTLEEKAGQLEQENGRIKTGPGGSKSEGQEERIARGQVGSMLNVIGVDRINALQHIAVEKSRLHIPLLFAYDVIHGYRTMFPVPLALSATWDTDLIEQTAHVAAQEAAQNGIRWVFSPMVDIARDARWGRIVEGAGEDPYLGGAIAAAYVRGYQGHSLSNADSVAACVKHFAGYGAVNAGREYNSVDMSDLTLRQFYLPPYHAAVATGSATLMTAFNSLNGVPATANTFLLKKTLRHDWTFRGVVVSDWGAIQQLVSHGIATDDASAARLAANAGLDVDMVSGVYLQHLPELVRSGKLSQATLDEAVRRVLKLKFELGLFDHPYTPEPPKAAEIPPASRNLTLKAAEESVVLLKNASDGGNAPLLPLAKEKRVALIGPLADSTRDMLGSWIAQGQTSDVVTLRSALAAKMHAGGQDLLYAKGMDIQSDSKADFAEALSVIKQADVVVMALGESGPQMSGEMASRTRLDLPGNQQQLVEAVAETGKPIVLVLFNGHPLALPWAAEHVPAIVEAWFPGIEAGPALANILTGDTNPSGHLTVTIPRAVGQEPLYYNQYNTGRPVPPGATPFAPGIIKKGPSHYIDEIDDPLFTFGYGLSYTTFIFSKPQLSTTTISAAALNSPNAKARIRVSVDVTNIGNRAGDEVVQLYIRNTGSSVVQPLRELEGFRRISMKPGETVHVDFHLGFNQLAIYNSQLKQIVEPSHYKVFVGDSSATTLETEFTVTPSKLPSQGHARHSRR